MKDPGNKSGTSILVPISISFLLTIYIYFLFKKLFMFKNATEGSTIYRIALYAVLPLLAFLFTLGSKFATQQFDCGNTDAKSALLGALPVLGTIYIGLFVSNFSACRIPVVSVFASGDIVQKETTPACCTKKRAIGEVEVTSPSIKAIAYGFYLAFSIFFGVVLGNGYSTIC